MIQIQELDKQEEDGNVKKINRIFKNSVWIFKNENFLQIYQS